MKRLIGLSVFWLSGFCFVIPFLSAQDEPAPAPPSEYRRRPQRRPPQRPRVDAVAARIIMNRALMTA